MNAKIETPEAAQLADACVDAAQRCAGLVNRNKDTREITLRLAKAQRLLSEVAELLEGEE